MMTHLISPLGLWQRLRYGIRKLHATEDWPNFAGADWPDTIFQVEATDRHHVKQGRSIARWRMSVGNRTLTVYLKRHYRLPRWQGWLATLFPGSAWSPGLQEWNHLHQAAQLGLPLPRPVAAGEWIGPWGRLRSFLAVEELTGMLALHEAIPLAQASRTPKEFADWKRGLTHEIVRLTRLLHDRQTFHKDLYLCHFYIAEADIATTPRDWAQRVVVIDLHRLARHRCMASWWRIKDLAQLAYSSEIPGVTARDRLRFWKLYRFGLLSDRWAELMARMIRTRWHNYRRHNGKRQAARRMESLASVAE